MWLRLVPLAVFFRCGMGVVHVLIAVDDLVGLICHYAHYVGMIFAAALIERDGFLGNVEGAVAEALFYVDENVGEVAAGGHNVFSRIRALAGGILAHVNFGGLRGFAVEFPSAT